MERLFHLALLWFFLTTMANDVACVAYLLSLPLASSTNTNNYGF